MAHAKRRYLCSEKTNIDEDNATEDNERELFGFIDKHVKNEFKEYLDRYLDNQKNIKFDENKHSLVGM